MEPQHRDEPSGEEARPILSLDTTPTLSTVIQEAADHVEILVEKASELLGQSLDDSSLGKLAQLSKEMGVEQDQELDAGGHGGNVDDDEGSESHVSGVDYVTAPSSPIIHVSALTVSGEETSSTMSPSLSRRLSRDGTQLIGRKLRFTTISGEVEREVKGRRSLDAEKNLGGRSDPGTPNLSET
jgi:hypothetical protein